jgi:hypothetical protein
MAWDADTRAYIERRVSEGEIDREALRSLKCAIARQIWHLLYNPQAIAPDPLPPRPPPRHLRCSRTHAMHTVKNRK